MITFLKKFLVFLKTGYVQILFLVFFYILFSHKVSFHQKNLLFSSSVLIKDIISLLIPITIVSYISFTVRSFGKKASLLILLIFLFELTSNFCSSVFGVLWSFLFRGDHITVSSMQENSSLEIIFRLPISKPSWYSCDKGVVLGIILGLFFKKNDFLIRYKKISEFLITKIIRRLIPIFVVGHFANMHHKKIINDAFSNFGFLIFFLFLGMMIYIFMIYMIANEFKITKTLLSLKNMLPAWITSLTTGCSLSTMPLTIECASKNMQNSSFAKSMIPTTTNIQQVGDSIMISFICSFIYKKYFGVFPEIKLWLYFSFLMSLVRFSATAVVGGTIFIVLPIAEKIFNFSGEMAAVFLSINMILDPIVTSSNVLGNGGLCQLMEKIFGFTTKVIFSK